MSYIPRQLLVLFLLCLLPFWVHGQRSYNYFSFGVGGGFSHYQGDLDGNGFDFWNVTESSLDRNTGNPLVLMRPAFGLTLNYHFHPYMYARLSFMRGAIGGDDVNDNIERRRRRGLNFESSLTELGIHLVYEFFAAHSDFRLHHSKRLPWTPYIFSGVNVFMFNPRSKPDPEWLEEFPGVFDNADDWVNLRDLGTEGQFLDDPNNLYPDPYDLVQVSIPFGIGFRFKLTDMIDLRLETGLRMTFTDYLDDVSGGVLGTFYADPAELINQDVKSYLFADRSPNRDGYSQKRIRGSREQNDWYGFTTLTINFILDSRDRCPKFLGIKYRKKRRY